jgi:hypothetical protein
MELMPKWQVQDYDAGVIGFYNSDLDGGNNDADIGTGDNYLSIEANVTDNTVKHVVLQDRTTGNVGIGNASPSEKLEVSGNIELSSTNDALMISGNPVLKANGTQNIFVGRNAGDGGSYNTFVGEDAGKDNTGISNTFIGRQAGRVNTSGGQNVFLGLNAGYDHLSGSFNTLLGRSAGGNLTTGSNNTFVGGNTGNSYTTPANSTFIGYNADASANGLTNATAIGYNAVVSASNCLVLGSSSVNVGIGTGSPTRRLQVEGTTTVELGHFDNFTVSGGVGIEAECNQNNATNTGNRYGMQARGWYGQSSNYGIYAFGYGGTTSYGIYAASGGASVNNWSVYASGNTYTTGGSWTSSDERVKKGISSFDGAISKIGQLAVKTYHFDIDKYPTMNFSDRKQYGIMAQNLEKVFPEMVMDSEHELLDKNGEPTEETINIKGVNYDQLIPVTVKAIQEQQEIIENQNKVIDELTSKYESQQKQIDELKNMLRKK